MCADHQHTGRSLASSVLSNRCPHCREGRLFKHRNPYYLKEMLEMPEHCPVCGQAYELQVGFYYGTGYVSYGLSVLTCALSFILWYLTVGVSLYDNRLFWWLGINAALLVVLQPMLQRLSRSIWIALFVRYEEDAAGKADAARISTLPHQA